MPQAQGRGASAGTRRDACDVRVLYATCTYNAAENEAVVQALLEQHPATLQPITLPVRHSPGLQEWQEHTDDERMQLCWRLYPHETGSVGFFLASIRA